MAQGEEVTGSPLSSHTVTSGASAAGLGAYRGTALIRKRTPQGPYRRPMPRVVGGY